MRDTINIPNPKLQLITVRIEVEVTSYGESEALRTKRRLPTSFLTPHRSPLVKKGPRISRENGDDFGESKSGWLTRHLTIVHLAPFRLNQRVAVILQISSSPRINRQLMMLKDPYFLPRKSSL